MAKFNKDTFINEITSKVQAAIDKQVINREDVDSNDLDRLHGFIQFELIEYIEDRKFAIDVLKDFNYDEKTPWDKLQEEFGTFKSVMDLALVNLWKFLEAEGATKFDFYNTDVDPDKAGKLTLGDDQGDFGSGEDGTDSQPDKGDDEGTDDGMQAPYDNDEGFRKFSDKGGEDDNSGDFDSGRSARRPDEER